MYSFLQFSCKIVSRQNPVQSQVLEDATTRATHSKNKQLLQSERVRKDVFYISSMCQQT